MVVKGQVEVTGITSTYRSSQVKVTFLEGLKSLLYFQGLEKCGGDDFHHQFNLPIWPVQKTCGSWRMILDYCKLNQTAMPIAAAATDVTSLLEQISTSSCTWHVVIDMENTVPPYYLLIKTTRHRLLSASMPAMSPRGPALGVYKLSCLMS
jgi:hypothetical protein